MKTVLNKLEIIEAANSELREINKVPPGCEVVDARMEKGFLLLTVGGGIENHPAALKELNPFMKSFADRYTLG